MPQLICGGKAGMYDKSDIFEQNVMAKAGTLLILNLRHKPKV